MMKSHVTIIACSDNADHNTATDIGEAVKECGGQEVEVADNGVIQATVPTHRIADIDKMEGVRYVRSDMTYAASN